MDQFTNFLPVLLNRSSFSAILLVIAGGVIFITSLFLLFKGVQLATGLPGEKKAGYLLLFFCFLGLPTGSAMVYIGLLGIGISLIS